MSRFPLSLAACTLLAMQASPRLTAEAADMGYKPGLWENKTLKMVIDGKDMSEQMAAMMAKREQMMAALPPDQRARIDAMMKSNGMSQGGDSSFKICISPEMAKRATPVVDKDGRCPTAKVTHEGNRTSFEMNCTLNGTTTVGKGTSTISGDVVTNAVDMTRTDANGKTQVIHAESEMHYLGSDCGDVKPISPPAQHP